MTLVTEGVSNRDSVLVIGMNSPEESVYLQGGSPEKSAKYTGLDPIEYVQRGISDESAHEAVEQFFNQRNQPFIVGYNVSFLQKWFDGKLPDYGLSRYPLLDIVDLWRVKENRLGLPDDITDISGLIGRMGMALAGRGKRPSFTHMATVLLSDATFGESAIWRIRLRQLVEMWSMILQEPF